MEHKEHYERLLCLPLCCGPLCLGWASCGWAVCLCPFSCLGFQDSQQILRRMYQGDSGQLALTDWGSAMGFFVKHEACVFNQSQLGTPAVSIIGLCFIWQRWQKVSCKVARIHARTVLPPCCDSKAGWSYFSMSEGIVGHGNVVC